MPCKLSLVPAQPVSGTLPPWEPPCALTKQQPCRAPAWRNINAGVWGWEGQQGWHPWHNLVAVADVGGDTGVTPGRWWISSGAW